MAGTATVTVLRPKWRAARAFPAPPPLPAEPRRPPALVAPVLLAGGMLIGALLTTLWPRALAVIAMGAGLVLAFAAGALFWRRVCRRSRPSHGG